MLHRYPKHDASIVSIKKIKESEIPISYKHKWSDTIREAVKQIRHRHLGLKITLVRPGNIATSPDKTVPPAADVNAWAQTLHGIFDQAYKNNMRIADISLGPA